MPSDQHDANETRGHHFQNNKQSVSQDTSETGRRRSTLATDAAQLLKKVQRRSDVLHRAEHLASEREDTIKMRYTDVSNPGVPFDRDALLSELTAEAKFNFLRLDRELSEDHNIATRRLHAAVFSHAADFLQLFRDVNRASSLVESLKGSVQGTKAAISAISNFSTYNNNGSDEFDGNAPAVASGSLLNSIGVTAATRGGGNRRGIYWGDAVRINDAGGYTTGACLRPSLVTFQHCDGSSGNSRGALRATTRSLNTPSLKLWRETILSGWAGAATTVQRQQQRHPKVGLGVEQHGEMPNPQEIILFLDVLRDEVTQAISGRRYLEAAELLRGMETEVVARGCLPLFLALEESLVHSIRKHLQSMPMLVMYSESLHIPLIQLLLRLGRVQSGSQAFFSLHAAWVDREMNRLQFRMDARNDALIASDFLVEAVLEVLRRQENLWHSIAASETVTSTAVPFFECPSDGEEEIEARKTKKIDGRTSDKTLHTATITTSNNKALAAVPKMPPSSAAVLWVRDRLDKLVHEVLEPRALSYGIGTEGGDPSRFRRAVVMTANAVRTVRRMEVFGYPDCDTHLLRLLTPILVYLQAEFSCSTDSRLKNTGRTMMEHLIRDVRRMYQSRGATFSTRMCEEVVRRNNHDCRQLHQRLKRLPRTSYALLLELLLAPASSGLFSIPSDEDGGGGRRDKKKENPGSGITPRPLLSPEQYSFLRHANGCSRVHGLFLTSVIRFMAAMTGNDLVPLEHVAQQYSTGELWENELECVLLLLSNAFVTESLSVTIQRLFLSFLRTALWQRQRLVTFLCSPEFAQMHHQLYDGGEKLGAEKITVLTAEASLASPPSSPTGWVLGTMQLLLADVLSASVWVAFLSRGGALSQILLDSTLTFRLQHLEDLHRVLPPVVQSWMAATLILAHSVDAARGLFVTDTAALFFGDDATSRGAGPSASRRDGRAPTKTNVGASTAASPTSSFSAFNPSSFSSTAEAAVNYVTHTFSSRDAAAHILRASAVKESRLMSFLISLAQDRFQAPTTRSHEAALFCMPHHSPTRLSSTSSSSSVWCVRGTLSSYPRFPLGGGFDHDDELFLFHWCTQISLNTFVFFQERLLLPSHLVNGRWAAENLASDFSQFLLSGCVSPEEESVLGALSAGGGNYASGVALLQFIVFRLLRDVLCCAETWSAVYGLPVESWKQSGSILRQQVFFFALFLRLWSPLFVDDQNSASDERLTTENRSGNVDGLPSMAILQWLTCATPAGGYEGKQQGRQGFDVGRLTFPLSAVPSKAATLSSGLGTWRNQHRHRSDDKQRQHLNASPPSSTRKIPVDAEVLSDVTDSENKRVGVGCKNSLLLLDLIGGFFDSLQESRVLPAILSDVTRCRVERVFTSVNLSMFSGKKKLNEDNSTASSGSDSRSSASTTNSSCCSSSTPPSSSCSTTTSTEEEKDEDKTESKGKGGMTLQHLHDLLVHYVTPLL